MLHPDYANYVIYTAKLMGYRVELLEGHNYPVIKAPNGSIISPSHHRGHSLHCTVVVDHMKTLGMDVLAGYKASMRVEQSATEYEKNSRS